MDLQERFWKKVRKDDDGCWRWLGATDGTRGYGVVRLSNPRRLEVAHRLAYGFLVEPVPKGRQLARLCNTPSCVNPAHLRLGPPSHCPAGHSYAETGWVAKDGTPQCRVCHRERQRRILEDPEERARNYARNKAWRQANPDRSKATLNRSHRRVRERWRAKWAEIRRGLVCIRCGESNPACLDFHHREPAEKEYNPSNLAATGRFTLLEAELAKCDVLCSNCHRKLHAESRSVA